MNYNATTNRMWTTTARKNIAPQMVVLFRGYVSAAAEKCGGALYLFPYFLS